MMTRLYIFIISIVFLIQIEGKISLKGKLANRINLLLNITGIEKEFNNALANYIDNDPSLSTYKSDIMLFINKFLSFESLRPHIIKIYQDLYTLSDINGMIKFYLSPLGKKVLEQETKAENRLSELIKNKFQEQMPQIISWFQQLYLTNLSNNEFNETVQTIK